MSYVTYSGLGASASASVCIGMGCPKPKPKKKAPPPPKLEPQPCYSKTEHDDLVSKCRGLSGFGDFTTAYYAAITKDFACLEAAKPICTKPPPKKPGLRMDLPEAPPPKPKISSTKAAAPPPKPKITSTKPAAAPMPQALPLPYAPAPEESGISTGTIVLGALGVAAVGGILYMVFR
jgi:hypothetical protein